MSEPGIPIDLSPSPSIRYDSSGRPVQIPNYDDYAPQRAQAQSSWESYRQAQLELAKNPPSAKPFAPPPSNTSSPISFPPAPPPATPPSPPPANPAASPNPGLPVGAQVAGAGIGGAAVGAAQAALSGQNPIGGAVVGAAGGAGAWAGAQAGAAVGALAGPVGAAVGGGIGAIAGGFAGQAAGSWAWGAFNPEPPAQGAWDLGTGKTWTAADFPPGGRYEIVFDSPGSPAGNFAVQIPADAGFSTEYFTRSDGQKYWSIAVPSMNIPVGSIALTSPNPKRITPLDGQPQPIPPPPPPKPTVSIPERDLG